jgi:hypothetical protein
MVDRFHSGDSFRQPGIMEPDMFDQFLLRIRRAGDENSTRVCDRFGDGLEILVIHRNMPATDGICLVMDVSGRMVRMQHQCFDVGRAEMKHASFTVIDPDRRMIMMFGHPLGPFQSIETTSAANMAINRTAGEA